MFFSKNLKLLRKRAGLSQQDLADSLNVTRSSINSYERGVQPSFEVQIALADQFKLSMDALIRYDLSALSEYQWSQLNQGFDIDITGRRLRLLTVTVNEDNKENIELVDHKARAGYTTGYADPEFISSLPHFQLPYLPVNRSYRCFQIQGDSMPPVHNNAWVTASYVENWTEIKNGERYIVITREEGIVFKVLYNHIETDQKLLLVSTNTDYEPYEVAIDEVLEIWKFENCSLTE